MIKACNVPPVAQESSTELITFRVQGLLLGIDILHIKEINCQLQHAPVPYAQGEVCGVINLRGEVLTVIDLARLLRLPPVSEDEPTQYVIVMSEKERIALLVDTIEDVVTVERDEIKPVPANVRCACRDTLRGVFPLAAELLIELDVDRALCLHDEPAAV
jgi:purine-binding chemotaxis protein CheW